MFLDFSCKSLTMLKGEGCFFPPPAASHPPGGLNSTPDSEDWGGGGGGRGCGWRAVWRAAGCPVWRPGPRTPQILHCLRGQHCPGNWPKAIKDQPKGRSHPRTDAGHPPSRLRLRGTRQPLRRGKMSLPQTVDETAPFSTLPASLLGQSWPVPFPGHPEAGGPREYPA